MRGNSFVPRFLEHDEIECDESWYQGKGVYGGLIFAYFVEGLLSKSAFPIRSLQVELCRPLLAGRARYSFSMMCRGSSTEFWQAVLYQEERVVAIASAVMGKERNTFYDQQEHEFPSVSSRKDSLLLPYNPIMPQFCQHISYNLCIGGTPFSGSSSSHTGGWIDFRNTKDSSHWACAVALMDAWWPSMVLYMKNMHYMGTVSFSCHFFAPLAPPYLFVGKTRMLNDGYASESNELWSTEGQLVAMAQQLIAIIH